MSRIIISGVGNGMGCNVSRFLKSKNHELAIVSRGDAGAKVAKNLGTIYGKCDLLNFEDTRRTFREIVDRLGNLDGLVHLAGGYFGKTKTEEIKPEYFNSALTNNAVTFYNAIEASLPLFPERGGSIVVISAARNVYFNSNIGYAAGKGAVDYMVRLLANELIPRRIRVNAISPGFMAKENCGEGAGEDHLGRKGRHGAINVSEAVGMFIDNNILTGQILEIDAGFSLMLPDGY